VCRWRFRQVVTESGLVTGSGQRSIGSGSFDIDCSNVGGHKFDRGSDFRIQGGNWKFLWK